MPFDTSLRPVPCHAVIFISQRTPGENGYGEAAERLLEIGAQQPGFLGITSVRTADGAGITVAFYRTAEDARQWGRHPGHRALMQTGRDQWYESYVIYYADVAGGHDWLRSGAVEAGAVNPPAAPGQ